MTALDTKAIRARADAATAGPWAHSPTEYWACIWHDGLARPDGGFGQPLANVAVVGTPAEQNATAKFIAAARADVPALCDRVEALEAALRKTLAALEVATTPLARDRTEVVDAMRVARAALEGSR